jgi:hypothetical protein
MHHDSPITYLSLLRTHKIDLSREDSWLIASIMALPVTLESGNEAIASSILNIFSGHSVLKKIKRVALVRRLGKSNQLMVLSSANSGGIPNSMTEGYSCFVSSNGSLFSIKPNAVRFFSEANEIVKKYESAAHPPQRSISRIAKMRLGGGVCSAYWRRDRIGGFLFLNGDISAEDLATDNLALLLNVVFSAVQKFFAGFDLSESYYSLGSPEGSEYIGHRLNTITLGDTIRRMYGELTGDEVELSVRASNARESYLVSHGNIAQIIARVMAALDQFSIVSVDIVGDAKKINFKVTSSAGGTGSLQAHHKNALDGIRLDAANLGISVECAGISEFELAIKSDMAAKDASVDYSVEMS